MARIRDPNRDKAFEIYKDRQGDIDLVEIANQLNVPAGTIRGWKAKDKWDKKMNGAFQKNTERSVKNMERSKSQSTSKKIQAMPKSKEIVEEVEQLDNSGLTDKQKLFCVHYIKCFNATKAYRKAYGCSYQTAMANGSDLLRNTKIREEIQKLKQAKLNQAMLAPEDIFQKFMDIAFADITDYVDFGKKEIVVGEDEHGEPKTIEVNYTDFKESTEVDGSLISEVKQGKDGISIKLHNQVKALEWLAAHMDMATEEQRARIAIMKSKVDGNTNKQEKDVAAALRGLIDAVNT